VTEAGWPACEKCSLPIQTIACSDALVGRIVEGIGEGAIDSPKGPEAGSPKVSRKLMAIIFVAILLGTSGFYVWHEYYRHWNVRDVERAVVFDEDSSESYPMPLGFRENLEGRTVTVEMTVHSIQSMGTNLGHLRFIYPEGGEIVVYMLWGEDDFEAGDRIEIDVTFERSVINGNEGVYSPQICLPGAGIFASIQLIANAASWVSAEWAIAVEGDGNEVVVTVESASDPVSLGISRCSLRAGIHTDAAEYIDVLGWYGSHPDIDTINDLRVPEGQNGTIEFRDANADGYLDDGDCFILSNLTIPEMASGAQTYILSVEMERYPFEYDWGYGDVPRIFCAYLIMTSDGVLSTTSGTPNGRSFQHIEPEGMVFTIDYISEPTSWDDVSLRIHDDFSSTDWACYTPNATDLESEPAQPCSCGVADVGGVPVECVVVDVAGNGHIDAGDSIRFHAWNGTTFNASHTYEFFMMHEPTYGSVVRETIEMSLTPTSECILSTWEDLVSLRLGIVHNGTGKDLVLMDLVWDDVVVSLDDGENSAEWALATDELDGGTAVQWTSDDVLLGDLSVVCSVTDLQGNGLANTGDCLDLSVSGGDEYDPGTEYTLALIHAPTGAIVFAASFSG
jgi:hypothetical protein